MDHPKFRKDALGNLLLNFGKYGEEVEVAAISGDGRRVLTVGDVGVAQVWDVEGRNPVSEIKPASPLSGTIGTAPGTGPFVVFVEAAALNQDGTLALLGLNDGTAVVYRVDDAVLLSVLHPPDREPGVEWGVIRAVRYSAAGDRALVGFPSRSVGVWSADGSRLVSFLAAPLANRLVAEPFVRDTLVSSVASSTDGCFVFGGAVDQTAAVFDVASGAAVVEATDHAESILAIFDDGDRVGWATTGGTVWLSQSGSDATKCLATGEAWAEATFDAERVLVRNLEGSVVLWSFGGERTVLHEPAEPARTMWARNASTLQLDARRMLFPENGKTLAFRDGDTTIVVERDAQIVRAAWSPRGDVIATDGWKNEVELWNAKTGEAHSHLRCPGGSGCFAFSPDGRLVATGEIGHGGGRYPRQVYVYEVDGGKRRFELSGHNWQIREIAFSPDGRLLASLGDELLLWDLSKRAWFRREPILRVDLSRATGTFAFAHDRLVILDEGRVRIFERATEVLAFEAPFGFETPWALSSDATRLCVGAAQAVLRFDLASGALERAIAADILRPERFPPLAMAKEHRIRGGAMLWRTPQGAFLHQSDGPRGWVEPLDLSSDGLVVLPCEAGAAILKVGPVSVGIVGTVPFEGKLRAGRVVGGEVLLVNERGRCFRSRLSELHAERSES
ncbi:MAG: WD40 repeat domain-containing protein [Myxococcales bacterium]